MKAASAPRTARLSVRVRAEAPPMLRGLAAFHKKTVAEYIRGALGEHVESDMAMIARVMLLNGASQKQVARALAGLRRGVWNPPATARRPVTT